jgi:putative transposase
MPARNAIKTYVENGYYHVYNRGVEKRSIFQDQRDYQTFLSFLEEYLQPKNEQVLLNNLSVSGLTARERDKIVKSITRNNFNQRITVLAYALMPNHFHLFLKQTEAGVLDRFMRSLCTRYVIYFNRRNKRVGSLFQGVYKASLIDDEAYFSHISRYIHKQAIAESITEGKWEQPCSYPEYLGLRKTDWIHPEEILCQLVKTSKLNYTQFMAEDNPIDLAKPIFREDD